MRPATSAPPSPKTCSASVTGAVPATTSTTVEGLEFTTISGTTMGIPWAEQIHVFPNKQAHTDWMSGKPSGTYPTGAADAFHEGAVAQFRRPGEAGYAEFGVPPTEQDYFSFDSAGGLGPGTPIPGTSTTVNGAKVPARMTFKAYLVGAWMDPKVDHLCLQYADHAEFVPVYRTQGAAFVEFGFVVAERPQKVIGYDASGQVVGTAKAVMMPMGLPIIFQP
ncbi:hypothetical protein [Catenulispora pinisilvae]|uniref:hypothetical protein n=1 Tax=Catenulispora pinisilvae TaxID=2705253 RepID=UPI001891F6DB|nr:hypothetical protein [Catenulispora pinisilvae]